MAKTFYKDGKWTDAPRETVVFVCHCKNKYIKTRLAQIECLRCIAVRQGA